MYPHTTVRSRTNAGPCQPKRVLSMTRFSGSANAVNGMRITRLVSPGSTARDRRWCAPVGEHAGHVESRRRDVHARQQDQRLDGRRVDSGLLGGLADRGCGRACVAVFTRAAGKRDLAGVVAELGRPLHQQDVRPVGTVGRDQDQDRGLPLADRVRYGIVAAQCFRASRGNGMDKADERRRHDGRPEICRRQPACEVIGQRPVHIQNSDALLVPQSHRLLGACELPKLCQRARRR